MSIATGSSSTQRRATPEEPPLTCSGFEQNTFFHSCPLFERLKRDLCRGVEFGIETKALLYKRMCAYAGLHAIVIKGFCKVLSSNLKVWIVNGFTGRQRSTSHRRSLWTTVGEMLGTPSTSLVAGVSFNLTGRPCKCRPRWAKIKVLVT